MANISNSTPELKPSEHQVAGHRFEEGRLGSLSDESGRFYKPLQGGSRGDKETEFYQSLWADSSIPENVKKFFPKFYGTVEVPVGNEANEKNNYAVMEDLTHGYKKPCIVDVKMGKRTWYDGAPQKYIDKCLSKDADTTSNALGYRIAGMQVYDRFSDKMWKADRFWCKELTTDTAPQALGTFFSTTPQNQSSFDSSLAAEVLSGDEGLLAKLKALHQWFANQTRYHFYSASILVIYEGFGDASGNGRNVSLHLVDFAHVIDGNGKIDENFLFAIDAVVKVFQKFVE